MSLSTSAAAARPRRGAALLASSAALALSATVLFAPGAHAAATTDDVPTGYVDLIGYVYNAAGATIDDVDVYAYAKTAAGKGKRYASALTYGGQYVLEVPASATYVVTYSYDPDHAKYAAKQVDFTAGSGGTQKVARVTLVLAAPTVAKKPRIGDPHGDKVGATLTVSSGTWSYAFKAKEFSYQWLRNGKPIAKATRSTYRITTADEGRTLTVKVTAKDPAIETGHATTAGFKVPKRAKG